MFKISEIYDNNKSDKIEIVKEGDMFCLLVDGVKSDFYDNIFAYGENLFVFVKKGKFGVLQYDENQNEIVNLPCKFDTLDEYYHNLVFSKKDEVVYYNASKKMWVELTDAYVEGEFLYGKNEKLGLSVIIEQATGEFIHCEGIKEKWLKCEPCLIFCGRTYTEPVFYDIANGQYISYLPGNAYGRDLKPSLVKPIIINGENVVNICREEGKLGTLDIKNRRLVKPRFDEIKVEVKVTYKGEEEMERWFDVADIKCDDIISPDKW